MVVDFVLETLESRAFDPVSVTVKPPLFRLLLEGFLHASQKGEPTGAAFHASRLVRLRQQMLSPFKSPCIMVAPWTLPDQSPSASERATSRGSRR